MTTRKLAAVSAAWQAMVGTRRPRRVARGVITPGASRLQPDRRRATLTGSSIGSLVVFVALAGCAAPGPLHIYSLPEATAATIADAGAENAAATPSFVRAGETVTGFAYDPFTDHFFLRLAPGDTIRVVDRPARARKREFKLAQLGAGGGGDLAIRPRDGHVFALLPGATALGEFTRYGEFLRTVALGQTATPPRGLAYDAGGDRLLVLAEAAPARVTIHATDGRQLSAFTLDRDVAPGCLAFDSDQHELYARLAGADALGVFGADGRLRRTLPLHAPCFDVGPRSFLRMF